MTSASAKPNKISKELISIHKQINSTQQSINQKEQIRQETLNKLIETEKKLNACRNQLKNIKNKQLQAKKNIDEINTKIMQEQQQIYAMQKNILHLLKTQYIHDQHESMRELLSIEYPNQRSRNLLYYQYIGRAQKQLITELKNQQNQLSNLAVKQKHAANYFNELAILLTDKKNKMALIQQDQQKITNRISNDISAQNKVLLDLKSNENRLNKLLTQIHNKKENSQINNSTKNSFNLRKKQMELPTIGQITEQFGAKKEGGGYWKGIFISNDSAKPVLSIANGYVVYADELRGYGKTIIISHQNGYMTIYTDLSSIKLNKGQQVQEHEIIGTSGSLPKGKTGLYFEIRYHGKPIDPMLWLK